MGGGNRGDFAPRGDVLGAPHLAGPKREHGEGSLNRPAATVGRASFPLVLLPSQLSDEDISRAYSGDVLPGTKWCMR